MLVIIGKWLMFFANITFLEEKEQYFVPELSFVPIKLRCLPRWFTNYKIMNSSMQNKSRYYGLLCSQNQILALVIITKLGQLGEFLRGPVLIKKTILCFALFFTRILHIQPNSIIIGCFGPWNHILLALFVNLKKSIVFIIASTFYIFMRT